jgi:hypothetical protein
LQIKPFVKVSIESRLLGTRPRKIGKSFTTWICKENKSVHEALEHSSWKTAEKPLGAILDLGEFNKNLALVLMETMDRVKLTYFGE